MCVGKHNCGFVYAVLSLDISVWVCCVLALVLYFGFKSPILFAYYGGIFAIILVLNGVIPSVLEVVHEFIHNFSNHELIQKYMPVANENALKVIKEFMWCGIGTGENVQNHVYSCIFGHDAYGYTEHTSYPLSLLLRFGVVGVLCLASMFFVFVSNCLSLYYTDKFCKNEMKNYAVACASSVTAVIIAETAFPMALSTQMLLCLILLMYIPVSIRKSAKNEYVPESYELDIDD